MGRQDKGRVIMPYIKQEDRDALNDSWDGIATKGELEYRIASLMDAYMLNREANYTNLHDCCYAAQHMADEFRRRFLDARENHAKDVNGDVFTFNSVDIGE